MGVIYVRVCAGACLYIYKYIYIERGGRMRERGWYMCACVPAHTYMYSVHICVSMCVSVYMCVYVCVCICVCLCSCVSNRYVAGFVFMLLFLL